MLIQQDSHWPDLLETGLFCVILKSMEGGEGAMSPLEKKRIAAVKTADAINAIEGAPISSYARSLSASWARGELTGEQMKQALLAHHRRIAEQERQSRV